MIVRRIVAALLGTGLLALTAACGDGGEAAPPPAGFERSPYLTRVTPTTARMRWIAPEGARVALTAEPVGGGAEVTAEGGDLTGLAAGTRYDWSAAIDGREAAAGTFTTAPRDLSRPLKVIAFGDSGAPNESSRAVAALVARQEPRLMVTTGDNAYLVTLPQLLDELVFRPLAPALGSGPNYGTMGDHDAVVPAGRRALAEAFEWPGSGERYELPYGPLQVIALGLRGDGADLPFLRRALARPGPRARLVVVHQPLKAGNPLLPVIAAAEVTAVLAGHLHAYERREVAEVPGVPFLTVGTGGAARNDARTPRSRDAAVHLAEFGLTRIRLERDRATFTFIDLDGRERDRLVAPLRS